MRPLPPDGVYVVPQRFQRAVLGAVLASSLVACSEQVTSSLGCPELCTDQTARLRDTVLTAAVSLDTTFIGFPRLGSPTAFTLVGQGDTADVRIITRFDTLKNTFRPRADSADRPITLVDSATLVFALDTSVVKVPAGPVRLEAFDVDTTASDTVATSLLPLFRSDRAIGSRTFAVGDLKDTVRLPLDNRKVLAKALAGQRLRLGLRLVRVNTSGTVARLQLRTGAAPIVRYRVSPDTLVAPDTIALLSSTPADIPSIAGGLTVYSLVAGGALPRPASTLLAVGGLAGARSYLQFVIPAIVLDSVQVIRATLQLTQRPTRAAGGGADTLTLVVNPVVASPAFTDLFTAAQFLGSPASFGIDTLRLVARDSGRRDVEIVNLVRSWRAVGTTHTQRAIVLRAAEEGQRAGELDFFSTDAPAALRPTLRLTYVPRRGFGLP